MLNKFLLVSSVLVLFSTSAPVVEEDRNQYGQVVDNSDLPVWDDVEASPVESVSRTSTKCTKYHTLRSGKCIPDLIHQSDNQNELDLARPARTQKTDDKPQAIDTQSGIDSEDDQVPSFGNYNVRTKITDPTGISHYGQGSD